MLHCQIPPSSSHVYYHHTLHGSYTGKEDQDMVENFLSAIWRLASSRGLPRPRGGGEGGRRGWSWANEITESPPISWAGFDGVENVFLQSIPLLSDSSLNRNNNFRTMPLKLYWRLASSRFLSRGGGYRYCAAGPKLCFVIGGGVDGIIISICFNL